MKKDYREMNPYLLAIPVLAIGLQDSASACVSPAIASIAAAYPDVPISTVQLLVTLPSITVCIVSILYGWLSTRINPRTLVIAGLTMFIIGGVAPAFLDDFNMILACRALLGMGAGLTLPACDSIIPRLYEGRMRENMMGWNMTAGAIGVTIMVFAGGHLAAIDWHLSFLGYCIGIVSWLLVVLLLPKIPMVKSELEGEDSAPKIGEIVSDIKWLVWVEIIVYFVGNMFATMVTSNLSLFVEGSGLGTPADSGNALSLQMLAAAVGAFGYGWLKRRLGYNVIPFAWLLLGAGFMIVGHADSLGMVMVGMAIAGAGVGIVWPAYCMRVTELTSPVAQAMAIAIAGALQGFGNFFNPVVGSWIYELFGVNYGVEMINVDATVLLVVTVLVLVVSSVVRMRNKSAE